MGSKVTAEAGLVRVGAQIFGKQYGRALVASTGMNILQNGGDLTIIDAFDIATSTLSPTSSVSGSITMAGMNSIVDYNPFDFRNQKLKYLGGGKNLMEASLHISFNVFGEGFKFTIGAMGGTNATANMFTYIVTGNAGAAAQGVAADKN